MQNWIFILKTQFHTIGVWDLSPEGRHLENEMRQNVTLKKRTKYLNLRYGRDNNKKAIE